MTHPSDQSSTAIPKQDPLDLFVQIRSDLKVSRHLRDGEPVYVIQDPISFATHRLTVFQYRVLTLIDPARSLRDNFTALVDREDYDEEDETLFLSLISTFRKLGLIGLPTPGAKLFEQSKVIRKHRRRGKVLGALFAQIPLVRPDSFLSRTVHLFSWMFSKPFMVLWMVGMIIACSIIALRFADFAEPLNGLLATKNLPFLWVSFVILKIWHELGHGYACKKFGGFVPEMGMILIAGTPAAYCDASGAWSFTKRSQRLAVMCGGMFFESLIFIPSVFAWAFASNATVASCAYQLVILTSLTTILFNANPLMKFDGYYILSELIGIQNLRPRADKQIKGSLKHLTLGITPPETNDSLMTRFLLFAFGISASIYRFFLIIGIATMVAIRFPLIGLALAAFHILTAVGMSVVRTLKYLLQHPETEPVRGQAKIVATLLVFGVPLALSLIPVPTGVTSQGLVCAESEYFLNADTPGVYQNSMVPVGTEVTANQPLATLNNPRLSEELQIETASLSEAQMRKKVAADRGPAAVAWEQTLVSELEESLAEKQQLVDHLTITAPVAGKVVWQRPETDRGRFLRPGEPIARVVAGRTVLRTWVNEEQLGSIDTNIGGVARFRIPGRSQDTYFGRVLAIQPASEEVFTHMAVTQTTGGEILLDPETGRPMEAVFQIDILPEQSVFEPSEFNARVQLMLPRQSESIGGWAFRNCVRFVRSLLLA